VRKITLLFFSLLVIFSYTAENPRIKKLCSIKVGPSWPHLARMKVLKSDSPMKIMKKSSTDLDLAYGASIGLSFEEKKLPFHFELEYLGYTPASFFVKTSVFDSSSQNPKFYSNKFMVKNQGFNANVFFRIKIQDRFSPFLNWGWGFLHCKTKMDQRPFETSTNEVLKKRFSTTKRYNYSWNMGAGINSLIYKTLFLEIGYRYHDGGKVETKSSSSKENFKARLIRNEVIVALRYEF
jgi:opacity protein-like surface antigen